MKKLKSLFLKKTLYFFLFISTFLNFTNAFAQQTLVNVNGWNAYVHLPWDYYANPTATYPTIIFFPGSGEVGSNASLVIKNGPGAYIAQGWNGDVKAGTDSVKFIVISLQPPALWPNEDYIDTRIQTLKQMYRIDDQRLHLTGLSMGGWCSTTYVTADNNGGPYTYASQIATVVEVEGVKPDDNQPYPDLFDNFANSGGRLLGFEQINDGRDIKTRVDRMNYTKSNSGIFVSTNFGGGDHCCWEEFYGGNGTAPNNFTLDGINQNIYQWMARNPAPTYSSSSNQPPTANAGANQSIVLPSNSINLAGTGTDPDGTVAVYSWAKISGPSSFSITKSTSASTSVTSLVQGVFLFELKVTDNSGATSRDTIKVTVNASGNIAPVVNAGADITINSPISSVTLYGSGTDSDGTIASYAWAQVSGTSANIVSPAAASTSVTNLISTGTYTFRLTVTDDSGATAVNNVTVTAATSSLASTGQRKMIPIAADGGIYFFNHNFLQPGDTGCIQSGTYPYISLNGIVGTATQPITIINCGGQVINTGNNGQSYCYRIVNSRYFKFTGTGVPGIKYGFKAYWKGGFTGAGLSVRDSSSDYEVDHFEAQNVQNGFLCKIDPYDCEPGTWSSGWTIKNISFHDNYVHNTIGEGYYLINTSATAVVKDCKGNLITVEPVKANGVKVFNNICDSTGWDGIQVAASINAQIYNNRVTHYGIANLNSQQSGIILGAKSNGSVYNNIINGGTGEGLEIFGTGTIYVYNNVVSNAGWDGTTRKQDAIAVDDRPQPNNMYAGLQAVIINNTVVNAARNAVHLYNSYGTMGSGNKIYNNLLVKPNNTSPYDNPYTDIDGKTIVDTTNNIKLPLISSAYFANAPQNNYHILSTSPAIDKGLNAGIYGVNKDIDGISRPQGKAYDAGAYEYNSGTAVSSNQPPVANAGANMTIQLPVNKIFLDGSKSYDPDGSISAYKWTVINGPSGSSLLTPARDTTTLTLINTGDYTIRLTVTDNAGLTATSDIIVTLLAATPPVSGSFGKVIHVNIFDGITPYNNSQWNNWNINNSLTSPKFLYDDKSTGNVYAYLSGHERIVDNGSNYATTATVCPPAVLRLNSIYTSDRNLTIYGLDNTKKYRIELYASRANIVNDTRFTIGNVSDTINVYNNANDYAKFINVSPSSGKITVSIQRLNEWQYLAGFSILEQSNSLLTLAVTNAEIITQSNTGNSGSLNSTETVPDKMLSADFINLQYSMLTVKMNSGKQQIMNLSVVDASGRTFLRTNITLQKGYNTFNKFIPGITKGIYYIKLFTNNNFIVKPVLSGIK